MKFEVNNLLFDDSHEDCHLVISSSQGQTFAFVQALDLGMAHSRHKKPIKSRYWGTWDFSNQQESLEEILKYGGKWPDLDL